MRARERAREIESESVRTQEQRHQLAPLQKQVQGVGLGFRDTGCGPLHEQVTGPKHEQVSVPEKSEPGTRPERAV